MIVRKCLALTFPIWLILLTEFGTAQAERWSRQVSNSEWIPLANPRATQTQVEQGNPAGELLSSGGGQLPLSLPPAIQQQYQQQLLQLQKTQENIQKLLLLQQQLRVQQQLLQSQAFLPSGFSNPENDKQLHQSSLTNSQTIPELAPEVLVPPLPSSEALPPVYPPQNFLPQRPRIHQQLKQNPNTPQEFTSQDYENGQTLQQGQNTGDVGNVEDVQENQRQGSKRLKESNQGISQASADNGQNEEEEVQLVYVPAETLAQRGQPKRGRGRKQYPLRQQQQQQHHHENQGVESGAITNDQDTFARQLLQQIQMEHEEKAQFLKEERLKEIARLNEEQRALDRKARLQQEALQREQEVQRQREAEKKRKELERLEELAKQRELEKIREAREKQRMEELERRRLAEARAKEQRRREEEEARQREADRLALERQKELEAERALKQQRLLEKQREDELRATSPTISENHGLQAQALPLIRDQQFHRQHLTEISRPVKSKIRGRQRHRHQYQEQQTYREPTTTPSPNQPPLSVYMGSVSSRTATIKVSDVLKILKDAKTIAVLDTVGPDTPQVFVGPTNLDPPNGYAKFDLPYLSSIDHNRVERKVDKLPFFVAPLSFDPPPGYSKIPFPAPHIGSVVVNTLDNSEPKDSDDENPSPTPLIEPNSYIDGLENAPDSTTPSYESQTTVGYTQESSSTPKYEATYTATPQPGVSGSRFRFRQFYNDNKPASVISTSYYEDQRPTTRKHKYYEESSRISTESTLQNPKIEPTGNRGEEVSYSSVSNFKEGPTGPQDQTKEQDLAAQLALINQELAQHRESQRYNNRDQYQQQNPGTTASLSNTFDGDISVGHINDVRAPVGPTQYNLPAELPAISPHLPGLVNSLLDKQEAKLQAAAAATTSTTTSTTTTTTTTTTARPPTTTYRPRSRQRNRIVPTRPRTTTQASATSRSNVDRSRRPYSRSRSRFTTTTEEYRESSYEPTKARIPETTLRYNTEHRRPTARTQKYRNRDKTNQQSEGLGQGQSVQAQQAYENIPQGGTNSPPTSNAFFQPSGPEKTHRDEDSISPSTNTNDFLQGNYPPTTFNPTENYPPLREVTVNHGTALLSNDYSRSQNYPQSRPQEVRYRDGFDQATLEEAGLEKTPVNGFNYQAQNEETLEQTILQRPKEFPQLDGKVEGSDFDLATTQDPRISTPVEHRYSSIYDVNVPQAQPEYGLTGRSNFHRLESEKIEAGIGDVDPNESPIFVPLPQNKQEDYELQISSTEIPVPDATTEITTTSTTPVIIRQRVRGRLGTRVHHEPTIQTRPRGSNDEYVRFNVNQESIRSSTNRQRDGSKTRPKTRSQNHGSQVQTDGNDYIKIHVSHHQKAVATTTPPTTTTTTTVRTTVEDVDYGFIRPPNFKPVHPVENRFLAPVTFRPPLSEISSQSLISNDETESHSAQPQLLKTRQKYQPTPNRRLPGKLTTLPSTILTPEITTTTEGISVATALPDDTIYTVKPKSRPEEPKPTRIRGRIRRPGKKRVTTTSTTESVLEAHNELPLDENYPRISSQLSTLDHQPLYDENYEGGSQFSSIRNRPAHQFYDSTSENYPQEFVLNFGHHPEQAVTREEYDQTQLASNPSRKYSHSTRVKLPSDNSHSTTADIYGAESQWSTKLSRTSFQPSFAANRVKVETTKDHEWLRESGKSKDVPDIITAAPDVSSITVVVSSDDKGNPEPEDELSMVMGTTIFGRKTTTLDHTEKLNATTHVTDAPTTIMRERNGSNTETTYESEPWLMDRVENSTEQQSTIDLEKTTKKSADPLAVRKGTRRRRVRVRVRPAVDDFVTAESQHFNSAINSLIQDQYKYNPIRESKITTAEPVTSLPQKSILQDFLTEILKDEEKSVPVGTTTTTTELPEDSWTMSIAMTTPIVIPNDFEETTVKESEATTMPTTIDKESVTTEIRSPYRDFLSQLEDTHDSSTEKESWSQKTKEERKDTKSQGNDVQSVLDFVTFNGKDRKEHDINKVDGNSDGIPTAEDFATKELKYSKNINKLETFGENAPESSSVNENEQSSLEDNYTHPKNHRAKWSEVRYPSAFDHSQVSSWTYDTKLNPKSTTVPGLITKNDGSNHVKTISDYVKAIFDTMKSVEEETAAPKTEKPDDESTTVNSPTEMKSESLEIVREDGTLDSIIEATTQSFTDSTKPLRNLQGEPAELETTTTLSTIKIDSENTTLDRLSTTSSPEVNTSVPLSDEPSVTNPPSPTTARITNGSVRNSTESMLGKVLRTSTTTKVSHMTEICYRGRCIMTRPKRDERLR